MPRGKRKTEQKEEEVPGGDRENCDPNAQMRIKLEAILEEFDLEVESRCMSIQSVTDNLIMSLRNSLHVELMKLPKKYRAMSMREFYNTYQGDWNAIRAAGPSAAPTPLKTPLPAKITIKMDDGHEIDLAHANTAALSNKAREEAKAKLMGLQAQLNSLMMALK